MQTHKTSVASAAAMLPTAAMSCHAAGDLAPVKYGELKATIPNAAAHKTGEFRFTLEPPPVPVTTSRA